VDENRIEDVDKKTEDHVYDEAALVCMARPMSMTPPPVGSVGTARRIEKLYEVNDDDLGMFYEENDAAWDDLRNPYDDGRLVNLL
jgi:hypothetical protein